MIENFYKKITGINSLQFQSGLVGSIKLLKIYVINWVYLIKFN